MPLLQEFSGSLTEWILLTRARGRRKLGSGTVAAAIVTPRAARWNLFMREPGARPVPGFPRQAKINKGPSG